ncbi:Glutamyl-tRNA(Gln) amidotransferase subunit A [Zostera marina]|uniref:Glutamyl-tRNA(Gln) amidotransferase subunit A n=1 Tax=Zostera marina TaxID=29655 RepID=A0A0K9PFG0_ZOSMR|nr:Glutamyl-tRNA(Gln) amidotransferase subunit A [Zostera marina]
MGEFGFGITGETANYGTPTNPILPFHIPGGSSCGSSVAVAAKLVDFSLGIDTTGCIRIPASSCGLLGFRPSHGVISTVGVLINSKSLDTVGLFARDPSVLNRVGHVLLQASTLAPRRVKHFIIADDCFQLSRIPKYKTVDVLCKAVQSLSGYQPPNHVNIAQYIASKVPCLMDFNEKSRNMKPVIATLKALATVMLYIQRYEFKTNHKEWINSVKPKLGPGSSAHVRAALNMTHENNKAIYKIRTELRVALHNLLKDEGILVIPTAFDFPLKLNSKKSHSLEYEDRSFLLSSIAGMSGCCQVTIPLGVHDGYPVSLSLIAAHGADKFLLDTILDIYSSIQKQVSIASNSLPSPDTSGDMDASELLKEKGNAAYKGRQWNKAVNYYSESIKLNNTNATYYSNRAAAFLELGCFQQAEVDCSQAIFLDKKNVKAFLRRGTARESLMFYKEAAQDFKHALVLEPQNKVAVAAEKRLKKLS